MCELRAFERQVYSQFGEDGIIEEILSRTWAKGRCAKRSPRSAILAFTRPASSAIGSSLPAG